jgi:NAD(P)H dehydrogenase (quinone)
MKIGIIVHSQTGNTYSVAEKLKDKLTAAGHTVNIERITSADGKQADPNKIRIEKLPDPGAYDALVLASPVQAFSLAPTMKAYMTQLPPLNGKKIACFVTKGLPFDSTGGNQAISYMKKSCESRGGTVVGTGIVAWRGADLDKKVADLVDKLSALF